MSRKRPSPEIQPDLIVQRLAPSASFALLRPKTSRARKWITAATATTAGDTPRRCDAYPVELTDLNPALRSAVAAGLALAHMGGAS
jgi:hypothetical protein